MTHYKYLVIGGGMTGHSAAKGIRELDKDGSIAILTDEKYNPYNRPPLSKGLWKGDSINSIWRQVKELQITMLTGRTATSIDAENKLVKDDSAHTYSYEKLLLATGGTPRRLPFGDKEIIYFRTLDDYKKLHQLSGTGKHFAVIGGGFIGSEIAAALSMNGMDVTLVFPEDGIGGRVFPSDLSLFLNEYYREKGVKVLAGETVSGMDRTNGRMKLTTENGHDIEVDGVVGGIGIEPNTKLAEDTGIDVDDGILVDEFLQTNQPDIYAAGDVANFHSPALGKRIRAEHEYNANSMGNIAGRNMAGADDKYSTLPFFYSDLFDLGYEAVGSLDSRLKTFADWQEENRKGVIYYLEQGSVRGVLLWDIWDKVDAARDLIAQSDSFSEEELKGRLN